MTVVVMVVAWAWSRSDRACTAMWSGAAQHETSFWMLQRALIDERRDFRSTVGWRLLDLRPGPASFLAGLGSSGGEGRDTYDGCSSVGACDERR